MSLGPRGIQSGTTDPRYPTWIDLYDTLDDESRMLLRRKLDAVTDPPLVSMVFPVYNTPEEFLRQAIESVLAQLYQHWELCISDDCSTKPHVLKIIEEYRAADDRIHLVQRKTNGHISASSNSAVSLASGRWLCLMDHDDILPEHALASAVLALDLVPDAGLLYSDEDHIEPNGTRGMPYFKPGFDPLLLLGQNYFSHLCMLRRDLVEQVGGFRVGMEGSQDWDLVLRVADLLTPDQIVHVPHVLYHWRSHPESTASAVSAKPYVVEASRRVVQDHLDRVAVRATAVNIKGSSFNRIIWDLGDHPPKVSIVILPRSGVRLCRCIDSIRARSTYPEIEIVLLNDGAHRPPLRQYIRDNAEWLTVVEHTHDASDSAQRNIAAAASSGEILVFLHDDIEVLTDSWLEEMVGVLQFPPVAAVGAKLLYPDLTIQHAGTVVGIGGTVGSPHRLFFDRLSPGYFGRLQLIHCPSAVSWACMGVRRDVFDEVGGFSVESFTGIFGDVDLCLRLREAGWRTGWTPHAELIHHENPTDTRGVDGENAVRFDREIRQLNRRWAPWVDNDPAYNPNLSLAHETFPLAWPPRVPLA
jgi:GT2 family glycosyltransferase